MNPQEKLVLSGGDFFPIAADFLNRGHKAVFNVSGSSMWPLIRNRRDSVLLAAMGRPPRVGDIVLLKAPGLHGRYILHCIYKIHGNQLITLGDGCLEPDPPVPLEQVIGRVEKIFRGERVIHCDSLFSRLLSKVWLFLFPIRYVLLNGIHLLGKSRRFFKRAIK